MGYRFEPMVSHLQSLKVGVRNKFLTPTNSHLIRFPITAIIESEIFPNISPKCKELNKKVNPFLKRECNGCVHATFSGAGKGEYEVCA